MKSTVSSREIETIATENHYLFRFEFMCPNCVYYVCTVKLTLKQTVNEVSD